MYLRLPVAIKENIIKYSKGEISSTNKIELVVIFGDNVDKVKEAVIKIGGSFENLGFGFGIIIVNIEDIEKVFSIKEIQYIELPKTLYTSFLPSNKASCIDSVWNIYALTGKGVLVGFIDSGIDYMHPAFIGIDGLSRIDFIYDLGNKGVIWNNSDINRAIKSPNPLSIVPVTDDLGHGTHVAGIACAGGKIDKRYYGVAYESSIGMVKMTGQGKINYTQSTQLMRGIRFLIDRAQELGSPLVINLSFSTNDGAHNGSSLLEQYISAVSNLERISFVTAAGNEGDASHHVGGVLRKQQTVSLNVASDETAIILQLYKDLLDNISIEIRTPEGISSGILKIKEGYLQGNLGNNQYFLFDTGAKPFDINGEVVISFAATKDFLSTGTWDLIIYLENEKGHGYDIWLPVAEGLNPNTKFLRPNVLNTLGIPATVGNIISVGSYDYLTNSISAFSGRGTDSNKKPDIVAPGQNIESSIPGGGFDSLSGTSMAAPQVAGSAALLMEWGLVKGKDPYMYGQRLKYMLLKGAKRDRSDIEYPAVDFGYGTLCLREAMILAEGNFRNLNEDMKRQEGCGQLYIKENFDNFIVEYDGDIVKTLNSVGDACAFILDENYAVISIRDTKVSDVIKSTKEIVYVENSALYTLCAVSPLDSANILKFHQNPFLNLTGKGVLVGIIDTGIDYLNNEFMYEDNTTRISSIWDQTISTGKAPMSFNFGSEYLSNTINTAIALKQNGGNPYDIVPTKDEIGHGTAMAGIIAARGINPDLVGAAPDSQIVMVKLKQVKESTLREEGIEEPKCAVYEGTDVILGIKYLYMVSQKLNKPMVIYIPLGTNKGGHDGTSIIERYVDEISKTRGIAVVGGCGNEGDTETHTNGIISKSGDESIIELKVDEAQRDLKFEIWAHKPDKISISIVSPSGEVVDKIPAKLQQVEEIKFVFEGSTLYVKYFIPEEVTGDELISIKIRDAKPGIWKFKLIGDLIVDGRFDAWLYQRALIKEGTKFLSPNSNITLTIPSTSRSIISTAFYNQDNNSILSASGRGYTRDGRIKPDIASGGFDVTTLAPGGGTTKVSGSSAGSAVLAGAVALLLQWGIVDGRDKTLYSPKIKTYLMRGASKRPGDNYPNNQWGYGILNLEGAFENIRAIDRGSSYETYSREGLKRDLTYTKNNIYINIPQEIVNTYFNEKDTFQV